MTTPIFDQHYQAVVDTINTYLSKDNPRHKTQAEKLLTAVNELKNNPNATLNDLDQAVQNGINSIWSVVNYAWGGSKLLAPLRSCAQAIQASIHANEDKQAEDIAALSDHSSIDFEQIESIEEKDLENPEEAQPNLSSNNAGQPKIDSHPVSAEAKPADLEIAKPHSSKLKFNIDSGKAKDEPRPQSADKLHSLTPSSSRDCYSDSETMPPAQKMSRSESDTEIAYDSSVDSSKQLILSRNHQDSAESIESSAKTSDINLQIKELSALLTNCFKSCGEYMKKQKERCASSPNPMTYCFNKNKTSEKSTTSTTELNKQSDQKKKKKVI